MSVDHTDTIQRIQALVPGAQVTIRGTEIEWHDARPQPTAAQIAAVDLTPTRWPVLRSTLIDRMTEAEAAALAALLPQLPAKTQIRWNSSRWVWSDDSVVMAAAAALGLPDARVAELLAPDPEARVGM